MSSFVLISVAVTVLLLVAYVIVQWLGQLKRDKIKDLASLRDQQFFAKWASRQSKRQHDKLDRGRI